MEKDLKINERIAISVTSPDIDDSIDILLGVVQTPCSKDSDQVDAILNITDIMNQEDRSIVKTASFFVSITYTPWFLKSLLTASAPICLHSKICLS